MGCGVSWGEKKPSRKNAEIPWVLTENKIKLVASVGWKDIAHWNPYMGELEGKNSPILFKSRPQIQLHYRSMHCGGAVRKISSRVTLHCSDGAAQANFAGASPGGSE